MTPEQRTAYNRYHREYYHRPDVKAKQRARELARQGLPEVRAAKAERMRKWRSANPERAHAIHNKWSAANKAARRAYMLEWRRDNAERLAEYARAHPTKNPEAARARTRQWCLDNPEKARLNSAAGAARRRARLRAVTIGKVDRAAVIARGNGICGICHLPVAPAELALDHIIPISKGGPHIEDNLQVAHRDCNLRKAAKT